MSCDKLVFDLSQELEGSPNVFVKKDWLSILDNQSGQYASNQSVVDTSQLSNSNKYCSYMEAYLQVPMVMSLESVAAAPAAGLYAFGPATEATSADFSVGLKNWFGSIIHSISADYNGTTIIQQTSYTNMWNSFKLMTSLSWSDVATMGSQIGFYPDNALSWTDYTGLNSVDGNGICNNTDNGLEVFGTQTNASFTKYSSGLGNIGLLKRQLFISYDPDATFGNNQVSTILPASKATTLWKSYIYNKTNPGNLVPGKIQWAINATIYLKHIHSFFAQIPLLKGVFMKLTLNLNNCTVTFNVAAGGQRTLTQVSNAVGGITPMMITSGQAFNGGDDCLNANGLAGSYKLNISVGNKCLDSSLTSSITTPAPLSTSIALVLPAYTFNPVFEQAYLSTPVKNIQYTDIYQYTVPNQVNSINQLLTNGLSDLRSILILPFYSATSPQGAQLPNSIAPYQSPFDPAGAGPTSPLALLTNFNVVVSGQNMIYNSVKYSADMFLQQVYGVNAVNGNITSGLSSGCFGSLLDWEMEYTYYYVDLSRMLPVEKSVPKSVQIIGNVACSKALDLICFIEYGVDISIDVLTGARV